MVGVKKATAVLSDVVSSREYVGRSMHVSVHMAMEREMTVRILNGEQRYGGRGNCWDAHRHSTMISREGRRLVR